MNMIEEEAKKSIVEAIIFARAIERNHLKLVYESISKDEKAIVEGLHLMHSPRELQQRTLSIAKEYNFYKSPTTSYGLISKLKDMENELRQLMNQLDSLKHAAPDTFDDIASDMYSPYLRTGELKAVEYTYTDPQLELKYLHDAIRLARSKTEARSRAAKKRGSYWSRLEQVWKQVTALEPTSSQNSDFIKFAEKVLNAWNQSESKYESAEALSKDYKRYKKGVFKEKSMDKNELFFTY